MVGSSGEVSEASKAPVRWFPPRASNGQAASLALVPRVHSTRSADRRNAIPSYKSPSGHLAPFPATPTRLTAANQRAANEQHQDSSTTSFAPFPQPPCQSDSRPDPLSLFISCSSNITWDYTGRLLVSQVDAAKFDAVFVYLILICLCHDSTVWGKKLHRFIFAIALSELHPLRQFLAHIYFNNYSIIHIFHILYIIRAGEQLTP